VKINLAAYLLLLLIEECAEVIQRCCKAIRFGLMEKQKTPSGSSEDNNRVRMEGELTDLQAVVQMNQKVGNLEMWMPDSEGILKKKAKIIRYMKYSREECQTLEATEEEISNL
jgi:hypothetical protein